MSWKNPLKEIPEDAKPGWSLILNGTLFTDVKNLLLTSKFGSLVYGHNGSYDQWMFHEEGGGGSVIIPFTFFLGQFMIGVVEQNRPFQSDKPVLNIPRGFLKPGENHFEAAEREGEEELATALPVVVPLRGEPGNPNSAFFDTRGEEEGIHFYAIEVSSELLEINPSGNLTFKNQLKTVGEENRVAEGILGSTFIPMKKAALLGDMMTLSAITRLSLYLDQL